MAVGDGNRGSDRALRSWKEIASFFGRDERTVKRWEAGRGLPVHRVPGVTRASVYAYPSELEDWLNRSRVLDASAESATGEIATPDLAGVPVAAAAAERLRWFTRRRLIIGGLAVAGLSVVPSLVYVSTNFAPDARPGRERLSDDPLAREFYLSGNYQMALRTDAGLNRSVQLFTQAITQDPEFAAAYAGLATAYNLLVQYTRISGEEIYPLARAAAERALKLDPLHAGAHAALGLTAFYGDRDFPRSRELLEQALELDPESADTLHWLGLTTMQTGDFQTAVAAITRAQELHPDSRAILANKALILYHAGDLEKAAQLLRQLSETAPEYPAPHFYLADIYLDQGRFREAVGHGLEAARIVGNDAMRHVYEAADAGFQHGGRSGLLEAMLAEELKQFKLGAVPAYKVARVLAMLGRADEALTYLALAVAEHESDSLGIKIDSAFADLRDDRRYRELLVKAGHTLPVAGPAIDVAERDFVSGSAGPR